MSPTAPQAASEPFQLEIRKGAESALSVGGLRIVACRREVMTIDGGITVNVYRDDGAGNDAELVRIDLFRDKPHYHAPAQNQAETSIAAGDAGPVEWGVARLAHDAPGLVREAGFTEVADGLDGAALADAESDLRALFAGLAEPTEVSFFEVPPEVAAQLRGARSDG